MSPSIFPVYRKDPIQSVGGAGVCGGTTSATGSPKRVISTGCLVFRTRSKTARHFALNLEMAISSMDRASLPWSTPMVGQTLGIAEQARLLILLGTGGRVAPNPGSRKARPVSLALGGCLKLSDETTPLASHSRRACLGLVEWSSRPAEPIPRHGRQGLKTKKSLCVFAVLREIEPARFRIRAESPAKPGRRPFGRHAL